MHYFFCPKPSFKRILVCLMYSQYSPYIEVKREEWLPYCLVWIVCKKINVTSQIVDEPRQRRFQRAPFACFAMSHVAGQHHLVYNESTLFLVWLEKQILLLHAKNSLEYPHHAFCKTFHAKLGNPKDSISLFVLREALLKHIVVIHQLP